ncbi:MAG: NAD(P)/FAD-dependent oxidoreductase [Thermoleophilaceae bacterium]
MSETRDNGRPPRSFTARNVVIAGGGFAGFHTARTLEGILRPAAARVTLVNDANSMLYTPFMGAVAGGRLEPRHIVFPLREELERTDLRLGRVESAAPERGCIQVRNQDGRVEDLSYGHLVVALGSVTRTLPVPGLAEHAVGFKTLAEAVALRDRLLRTLEMAETLEDSEERASYLTFVFVGAGYAGLGGLAELQDFAADVIGLYPRCRLQGMRWLLVEARSRVMGEVPPMLSEFAERELRARGIETLAETRLEEVTAESVRLSTGETVPTRTVVWTAGVKPSPVVAHLGLPVDEAGRIRVDSYMRVEGHDNVWAVGDAAAVPDPARPGYPCPPTRQHGMRQGKRVAGNVAAALGCGEAAPFTYKTRGVFVDLGRSTAVALFMGVKLRGFPAWMLTRGYNLKQMPSFGRKLKLVSDWVTDLAFRRDSSEMGQACHPLTDPGRLEAGGAARTRFESPAP